MNVVHEFKSFGDAADLSFQLGRFKLLKANTNYYVKQLNLMNILFHFCLL